MRRVSTRVDCLLLNPPPPWPISRLMLVSAVALEFTRRPEARLIRAVPSMLTDIFILPGAPLVEGEALLVILKTPTRSAPEPSIA